MSSMNPVFNRIDKETQGYAGFGAAPQQSAAQQGMPAAYGPPQGAPQAPPAGYGRPAPMSSEQLEQMYSQPPAGPVQTGRVTLDDVIMKSLMLFAVVIATAGATWWLVGPMPQIAMPAWLFGMFGSLALGFVIARSKTVNVPLIGVHAVLQGLFIGAVSATFEANYPGIVSTAVLATVATFAGMFIAWKTGFIKVTSKSRRIFGMMAIGYLVFLLMNFAGAWLFNYGGGAGVYGMGGWLPILISVFGVGMASYSLAVDFDSVDRGVAAGAPERYSWLMGHGLVASLVWLYIEFLRLFWILNQR